MKRFLAAALAAFTSLSFAATLSPVQLLNPVGSTSGQAILSNGPSTPPSWGNISFSTLTGIVPITNGGTGASTQTAALSNLLGASTVPIANGGTGASTQSGALSNVLGSSNVPIANGGTGAGTQGAALSNLLGTSTIPVANGGTGSANAGAARTALSAAASGANSDITSLSGLTSALSLGQGGTGATTATAARTSLGLGTSATVNTGTSGATIPLLNTANTWGLAQTFTVRPTFNGATPWDSTNLNFATPPAIGATTPAAVASTTLSSSQNSAIFATSAGNQSIANGTFTTVTGWTSATDRNSNFNATTGVFTAPRAGIYNVSASIGMASVAWPATGGLVISVWKGATEIAQAGLTMNAAVTASEAVTIPSVLVSCAANDQITVKVWHSQGGTISTGTNAVSNWVSIVQTP